MRRQQHLYTHPDWPLALAQYDRSPLTLQEKLDSSQVLRQRDYHPNWFQIACHTLNRLVNPLLDTLTLIQATPKYRNSIIAIVLEHQLIYDQIFWQWSDDQWHTCYLNAKQRRQQRDTSIHLNQLLSTAYLLTGFYGFDQHPTFNMLKLVGVTFEREPFIENVNRVTDELIQAGFHVSWCAQWVPRALAMLHLKNYHIVLDDLTDEIIQDAYHARQDKSWQIAYQRIAFALQKMGILTSQLKPDYKLLTNKGIRQNARSGISEDWLHWIDRWEQANTNAPATRRTDYRQLLSVGRWLAREHPDITSPADWTRDLAVTLVTAVDRLKVGDWAWLQHKQKHGHPISAYTKSRYLSVMSAFFSDLQAWEWIPIRFDPRRCFAVPRTIQGLLTFQPKPIDPAIWKKMVIAALNLTPQDVITGNTQPYPFPMVKAIALTWVFSGLRPNEIQRLPVGCVRNSTSKGNPICWLDVPASKQNPSYTKPIDPVIGQTILAWEAVRPPTPPRDDPKTGDSIYFLFEHDGKYLGKRYLANSLIPLLCRVAGIPEHDMYGKVTPNRARHTIAYQLANGQDAMPLLELQAWLGHRQPTTTLHYTSRAPLEMSHHLERYGTHNTRLMTVLVDREAVQNGHAARGEPWKYYDVGHGYCTHDFFETCPHRIACAKCASYVPKNSSYPQLQEAKYNLLRMREAIPLTDEMTAAIDEGIEALELLITRLADIPTPSGETPHELGTHQQREPNIILLNDIPTRNAKNV